MSSLPDQPAATSDATSDAASDAKPDSTSSAAPGKTPSATSRDPLHGVTLEKMLTELVEHHGWEELGERVRIRCFQVDPSIRSSLTFLRRTPWARKKVEDLYVRLLRRLERKARKASATPAREE